MSDYLLISKRMKIKKGDAIGESKSLDNWVSDISEYAIGGFETFLDNIEATENIKLFAKNIEWELILSLFNIQFSELIQKFKLPKLSEMHQRNFGGFRNVLFESIKIEMYYHLYFCIKNYGLSERIEKFNDQVFDLFLTKMNKFIQPFDFQFSITSLRDKDDPKVLMIDLMEIQHKVEVGKKFDHGKLNRSEEVQSFTMINNEYSKLNGTSYSKSLKQIAREIAFKNHNYEDKDIMLNGKEVNLFELFYTRLLYYNKKK